MKKYVLSFLALAMGVGSAFADYVSPSQAKYVGQQFVQANFDESRQASELTLVQTGTSTRGEVSYYIFNVGNEGFVIVSADDNFRPIIGYSDEGAYDVDNVSPGFTFYMKSIVESRSSMNVRGPVEPNIPTEWNSVRTNGKLLSYNNGRGVDYLVQTKWNQNPAPFNSMCPADPAGSGGHTYVGCVATAMAQIMKYWNHPVQGQGSHSYYHPTYGTQSANFGQTTYDWDNMLDRYANNYTPEQGQAVALLGYHCGVAVDMNYAADGSGSNSERVPSAITSYFRYTNNVQIMSRSNNTLWKNTMKDQFDMGWPVYYAGSEPDAPYGHAFVCDGYDDNDLFHFNWGWGGSDDGWFLVEGIDYSAGNRMVYNFVPDVVYNNTAQAPTNFSVTPLDETALSANITWNNPSKNLQNSNLASIDKIVITRDGEVIYEEENVAPGAAMSFVDNTVPRYDAFEYKVYAVSNGAHGKVAKIENVIFGPSCSWSVTITKASMTGFRGGIIHVYNSAGTEFAQITTTNSSIQSIPVDMPLGNVSFGWTDPTSANAFEMGFIIKDSQNATVYTFNDVSTSMPAGVFFQTNNSCGNPVGTGVPSNLLAEIDSENPNNINVSWDGVRDEGYGYIVYRDDKVYRLIPEATSFVDENASMGGHCYYVGFLSTGGENGEYSNESCVTIGECYAPRNIDYTYTGSNNKIKLLWERPEPYSQMLSGYNLYRKSDNDDKYELIKLLAPNATSYTDNSAVEEGWYFYKLCAVYVELDECISAPANWIGDENQFHLHVLRTFTDVEETEAGNIAVYPNPAKDSFTIDGEGLEHVTVYNTIGQVVYDSDCTSNTTVVNLYNVESGLYTVRISTENGVATKRISVVR